MELRMLWALTGLLSPASFTRALPTGREAVRTPPLAPGLVLSLSEPRNVLRRPPEESGRFLILPGEKGFSHVPPSRGNEARQLCLYRALLTGGRLKCFLCTFQIKC